MNYIKTDDNMIVNEKHIRWVKKMDECLKICTLQTGCANNQTQIVCKLNNNDSYSKLNKYFD